MDIGYTLCPFNDFNFLMTMSVEMGIAVHLVRVRRALMRLTQNDRFLSFWRFCSERGPMLSQPRKVQSWSPSSPLQSIRAPRTDMWRSCPSLERMSIGIKRLRMYRIILQVGRGHRRTGMGWRTKLRLWSQTHERRWYCFVSFIIRFSRTVIGRSLAGLLSVLSGPKVWTKDRSPYQPSWNLRAQGF